MTQLYWKLYIWILLFFIIAIMARGLMVNVQAAFEQALTIQQVEK